MIAAACGTGSSGNDAACGTGSSGNDAACGAGRGDTGEPAPSPAGSEGRVIE